MRQQDNMRTGLRKTERFPTEWALDDREQKDPVMQVQQSGGACQDQGDGAQDVQPKNKARLEIRRTA